MSNSIIILGAGPAGLACAYKILKESGKKVVIIDQAPKIGGAGASFRWKGHILDYGPHAFHTRGGEPEKLIRNLFMEDQKLLIEGRKRVQVFLNGKRFRYPLQVAEALLKFNPLLSLRIIFEFALTSIFHAIVSIPIENFENWGRKRFGSTLYRLSFGDYTEKVWKTSPSKISEKFATEKIQGFNFINLLKRLLRVGGQVTEPYYQTWIYHKYGSGSLFDKLAHEIIAMGGEILLSHKLKSIEISESSINFIKLEKEGNQVHLPCGYLVSTIPLPHLVLSFDNKGVPFAVRYAASKLRYTALILVYIEFNMEKVSDDHWFYLLEKKFVSNRVTEQKNLSVYTMEPGKTVLMFELSCRLNDALWRLTDKEIFQLVKNDCDKINFIQTDKISDYLIKRIPNVYEIYYKGFDQYSEIILSYLSEFQNIVSIGRKGLFLQGDMHQSIEMGLSIGSLLAQERVDVSEIRKFYRKYVGYIENEKCE